MCRLEKKKSKDGDGLYIPYSWTLMGKSNDSVVLSYNLNACEVLRIEGI